MAAWAAAALTLAFHLALSGRYGFFRDELYFIACGRHLAWGYVDQPPLIALAARLAGAVFGDWLPGLRLLPALSAAGLVLLVARMAVRLGGGGSAVALAAVGAALGPHLVFVGHTLTMNAFEPLLWTGMTYLVLRLGQGASPRLWLPAGALAGLAMMNKHSAIFFIAALVAGLLATPQRRLLRSPWFAAGLGLAVIAVLPHAVWQVANDFPMLELLANGRARKNAPFDLAGYLAWQPLGTGPGFPVALAGLWALLRGRLFPEGRPLGVAFLALAVLLAALQAKAYYLAPAFPPLLAAGGVALERAGWLAGLPRRAAAVGLLLAAGLALAPATAPLLPPAALSRYLQALHVSPPPTERHAMGALPQHVADQFGWEEKAAAVERVFRRLPPEEQARARIFAQNYGQAGAIDLFGRPGGLPPAMSCHNSYWLWSQSGPFPDVWVVLGGRAEDHARSFEEVVEAERLPADPRVMPYEDRLGVFVLRRPRVDLAAQIEGCKNYI